MQPRSWILLIFAVSALLTKPLLAQCDSGSDGSDGAFNPATSVQVDLGLAIPGDALMTPGTGNGVYDATRWVVCFKYSSITIASSRTISFTNHPSGAPVVWLSQGDVSIDGRVTLDSPSPSSASPARGGPGGFDGGVSGLSTPPQGGAGFGPGGASPSVNSGFCAAGGGYSAVGGLPTGSCFSNAAGGASYGSAYIVPLIGGSGGSGTSTNSGLCIQGGSGGGGAVLIAAGTVSTPATINVTGNGSSTGIFARGSVTLNGGGGGSGGAIRLVANNVSGNAGSLVATGGGTASCSGASPGAGAPGRIRIDANNINMTGNSNPLFTTDLICTEPLQTDVPTLRVTFLDGQSVPADPLAGITTTDVSISSSGPVTIDIEATNVPPGTTVKVRVVPVRGENVDCPTSSMTCDSTPLVGTMALSTSTATITFTPGRSEIQLRANW